jgi:hypothetical protein
MELKIDNKDDKHTFMEYADMYKEGKLTRDEYEERFDRVAKVVAKAYAKELMIDRMDKIIDCSEKAFNAELTLPKKLFYGAIGLVVGICIGVIGGSKS